jgi:hypothetical protein
LYWNIKADAPWEAAQVGTQFRKALKQLAKMQASKPMQASLKMQAVSSKLAPADKMVKFEENHAPSRLASEDNLDLSSMSDLSGMAPPSPEYASSKPVKLARSTSNPVYTASESEGRLPTDDDVDDNDDVLSKSCDKLSTPEDEGPSAARRMEAQSMPAMSLQRHHSTPSGVTPTDFAVQEHVPVDFAERFVLVTAGGKYGTGSGAHVLYSVREVGGADVLLADLMRDCDASASSSNLEEKRESISTWGAAEVERVDGTVQRRFKDFKWLYKALINRRKFKAGHIPVLVQREGWERMESRFNVDFLSRRARMLTKWMTHIVQHPDVSQVCRH